MFKFSYCITIDVWNTQCKHIWEKTFSKTWEHQCVINAIKGMIFGSCIFPVHNVAAAALLDKNECAHYFQTFWLFPKKGEISARGKLKEETYFWVREEDYVRWQRFRWELFLTRGYILPVRTTCGTPGLTKKHPKITVDFFFATFLKEAACVRVLQPIWNKIVAWWNISCQNKGESRHQGWNPLRSICWWYLHPRSTT